MRGEVSALLSPSRRRSLVGAAPGDRATAAAARVQITIDALEDEAFLRALEEQLQQHVDALDEVDLVLGAKQINYLAFRLHEALEPKRDPETSVIQAWTIQPQAQLRIKMSSHIQVLKLSTMLREVRRLRIHQQSLLRSPIEMEIFPSLRVIEIVHTEVAVLGNVHFFARQLRKFRLEHTPLASLAQVLSPATADGAPFTAWKQLESLRINCCALPRIDACFNQLEAVKVVDLAWNEIAAFEQPAEMATLQWLDLRHNKLSAFPPLSKLSHLKVLDLSVNQIQSFEGLQALPALIDLDISSNQIQDIGELELLTELHELRRLVIRENPITRRPDYRREVLFYLGERVEVDDEPWTFVEIQSMKSSRQLQVQGAGTTQSVAPAWTPAPVVTSANPWPRTNVTMMYPILPKAGTLLPREADIIPPPRMYSPRRRNMQQLAGRGQSNLKTSAALDRTGTRSSLEGTMTEVTEEPDEIDRTGDSQIRTVDDFFRLQAVDPSVRAMKKPDELEIPVDDSIEYASDSDSSDSEMGRRSRKYTESDFMRDFEEEEAIGAVDAGGRTRRSSSAARKQHRQQSHAGGSVNVRVLLSAEDAAVFDLTFGIDGLSATVDVKSNEILETLHVPDRDSSIAFSRRLPDVVAIGTSTSARAKIVVLKLRKLDRSLNGVMYQIEASTTLARLLAPLLGHLYVPTAGHQQPTTCVCSNCGGVSHLSPEYVDSILGRAGASSTSTTLYLHSCLLCASHNVREVSTERMLAIYAAEGMTQLGKRLKPPSERRAQVEVGFTLEEQDFSAREIQELQECILISSNGFREVTTAAAAALTTAGA